MARQRLSEGMEASNQDHRQDDEEGLLDEADIQRERTARTRAGNGTGTGIGIWDSSFQSCNHTLH